LCAGSHYSDIIIDAILLLQLIPLLDEHRILWLYLHCRSFRFMIIVKSFYQAVT